MDAKPVEKESGEIVRTTLRVDRKLWISVRRRALEEGIPAQDLVIKALSEYLKASRRK